MIEISVQLTPRDMRAMRWNVGARRRWQPWALGLLAVILGVNAIRGSWEVPALAVVVLAAIFVASRVVVARAFRSSAILRGTQYWAIDESGLSYETLRDDGERVADGRLEWRALDRVVDTRDAFLLFTSARACMVIPKRSFSAASEIEQSERWSKRKGCSLPSGNHTEANRAID